MIILAAIGAVAAGFAAAVAAVLGAMSLAMRADERRADGALDFERHADQAIALARENAAVGLLRDAIDTVDEFIDLKLWEAELAS